MIKKIVLVLGIVISAFEAQAQVKHVYSTPTTPGGQTTWCWSIFSDGTMHYQDPQYDFIKKSISNNTFSSLEEFAQMIEDIKSRKEITTEKYTLKPVFNAVEVKIEGIPHTYTFTKYSIKLIEQQLAKFIKA